jgi:hypothetical protein
MNKMDPIGRILGDRHSKNKEEFYPMIEFDSWNDTFFLMSKPDSYGRAVSKKQALEFAKTKKYHFREIGQRGGKVDYSDIYPPETAYQKVKEWGRL